RAVAVHAAQHVDGIEHTLVAPPGRIRRATDLCSLSSRSMEIKNDALRACCMRDEFYKDGVLVARRPQEWRAVANTRQRRARSR
ncbi:hypothetical protein AZ65_24905, partial [Salmonella enterica subsp. enterica serovar Typhimurium]|nr:hypothetical protein [Salmonella enterica]EED4543611.1 hypothetical protein [Salmonella enterica subsp. enterica serovar Typhimurium]